MGQLNQGNQVAVQLYRSSQKWPWIWKIPYVVIKRKEKKTPPKLINECNVFTISITGRHRESRRGQLGPLGWRRAGLQDIIGHIFDELKKKSVNPRWSNVFPLLRPLVRCGESTDGPPTARGTVGDKTAMLNSPSDISLPVYSADISPPPLSEILFLHRFEQEEVGRWSRQKRQACGPLATSCSLFCDTKSV